MSNQVELDAAIEWYKDADWGNECFEEGVVRGFQAGAAYQRSIDKGLVEALESIAMCADGYSGAECSRIARSALKPYRAAQEKSHG